MDKCEIYLNFAERDREALEEIFGEFDDEVSTDNIVTASINEINEGGVDELREAAEKNIPLTGWHGASLGYVSTVFAIWEGTLHRTISHGTEPVVMWNTALNMAEASSVEAVSQYSRAHRQVWRYLRHTDEVPGEEEVRKYAREHLHVDGELEIDENAKVSTGETEDNGAYVQAWVFVDYDNVKEARGD